MELPKITSQQNNILHLIHRFRFLNSTQIQLFLNHKDKMRINLWLKDLCEKEYLNRIYSNTIGYNIKPAIYYAGLNAIRFIKASRTTSPGYMKNLYRDSNRSQIFVDEQIFLADICLGLRSINNKGEIEYSYETAADVTSNPQYFFMEDLSPQLLISKTINNEKRRYVLFQLSSKMPKYMVKKKIKNCIELFYSNDWEENINSPFPTTLFACETKALMIFAKRTAAKLLEDYQNPEDLELWFGINEDIKEYGISAKIWE